jgi:Flp pilus assembly pilin Flp
MCGETGGQLSTLLHKVRSSVRADDGQTLVEYSLILLLVALVCFTLLSPIGQAITGMFQAVLTAF